MGTTSQLALGVALAARVPVILWGPPGSGKSSTVKALAEHAGVSIEIVIASIREPSDFAGLPIVDEAGTVRFAPPRWARRLAAAGRGVLFLDEITTAAPAVQAALLRVVLERAVGDLTLPEDVVVVAAANPPEQAADGWDLSAPLANRFCHIEWEPQPQTWADGLLGGFDPVTLPFVDPALLAGALPSARAEVAAFVTANPHLMLQVPTDTATAGRAWPSPRTWEMAAVLSAYARAAGCDAEVETQLLRGAVGTGPATMLRAWRAEAGLPDPEAALANPGAFTLPERGDRAYAALAALVAAVEAWPTPQRWEAAWWAIHVGCSTTRPDIAVPALRTLIRIRPAGAMPPREVLASMAPLLRSAGLFERLGAD